MGSDRITRVPVMCFLVVDQSATTGTGRSKSRLVFDAWSALVEGAEGEEFTRYSTRWPPLSRLSFLKQLLIENSS
jgi:hypothetical protein